jgi:hypothetical protein
MITHDRETLLRELKTVSDCHRFIIALLDECDARREDLRALRQEFEATFASIKGLANDGHDPAARRHGDGDAGLTSLLN